MKVLILALLGLIFGSFCNALVWRLREQSVGSKNKKLSILNGRSMCPKCHRELSALDLIPLLSWLFLGGKCRYCHKPISWQYPLVELATAMLFVVSYLYWPYKGSNDSPALLVFWLIFLTGFIALTVYDLRWKLLPNKIIYPLMALAIVQAIIQLSLSHQKSSYLEGEAFGLVFSAGIFYLLYLISQGKWIGGGDVKLAIIIGLLVGGPAKAILVVFGASLIGSLISLPLVMSNKAKRDSLIAFGPFLICATIITYLFGSHIISWYQGLISR